MGSSQLRKCHVAEAMSWSAKGVASPHGAHTLYGPREANASANTFPSEPNGDDDANSDDDADDSAWPHP